MKYDPDDPLAKNCPPLNPSPEEVAHQKMLDLCMEKLGYSPDDLLEGLPSGKAYQSGGVLLACFHAFAKTNAAEEGTRTSEFRQLFQPLN